MRQFVSISFQSWLCWMLLTVPLAAQPAPSRACLFPPTRLNTTQQNGVIVLGRPSDYRYVVVVPGRSSEILRQVRQCVADAFLSDSRLGPYVHAGAFPDRASAESVSWLLRSRGLDARVIYR